MNPKRGPIDRPNVSRNMTLTTLTLYRTNRVDLTVCLLASTYSPCFYTRPLLTECSVHSVHSARTLVIVRHPPSHKAAAASTPLIFVILLLISLLVQQRARVQKHGLYLSRCIALSERTISSISNQMNPIHTLFL
jgi:hypothetical protein